ncbi:uncharacterized protein CDAR_103581 [Caerostris darwini]|uniref:Uncharacterized protein n=1 Tax=Caerostris darwini TaxID=1538125 RepID=A0AAV4PLG9_9ARAC|nr:uncharacterized protein CDAR_103581 [Caerostris darwini]
MHLKRAEAVACFRLTIGYDFLQAFGLASDRICPLCRIANMDGDDLKNHTELIYVPGDSNNLHKHHCPTCVLKRHTAKTDNSNEIKRKVEKLDAYFNDMKSRYLWAQNRMAEQNIWRVRNTATRIRANSHRLSILGDVWNGSKEKTNGFDVEEANYSDFPASRVFSNVVRSLISSARKQLEEDSNNKDAPEAEAMEIDNKMQVISLLAEIRERDEFISALTAQLKIKELEVNKLMEVIRREKLGML